MSKLKRLLPFGFLLLAGALFAAGYFARGRLDLDVDAGSLDSMQVSLLSLRARIGDLGWFAPALYVGMVTFRLFLLLPSWVILTVGGLAFGTWLGTALGTLGILFSAIVGFTIARGAGRDVVARSLGSRFAELEARVEHAGVWLVGLITAHPAAPMSSAHWVAGLTSMSFLAFLTAVIVSGPIRALVYAALGSAVVELDPLTTIWVFAATIVLALLPLGHRGVRRWLLGGRR